MRYSNFKRHILVLSISLALIPFVQAQKPVDPIEPTPYTLTIDDVELDAATGMIMHFLNETEKNIIIPDTIDGVEITAIRDYCFSSSSLTDVVLPSTLTEIGTRSFQFNPITNIFIPNKVTVIGSEAFDHNSLDSVHFEENSLIKYIYGDAFADQRSDIFTSIKLPTNANPTFKGYRGGNLSSSGKDSLYVEGETITNFEFTYQAICPYTLTIDDVDFEGFYGEITAYKNTTENDIIIPDNLNGRPVKIIGNSTFRLEGIKSVVFPNTLTVIEKSAFDANKLSELIIPKSVLKIESFSFTGMEQVLSQVTFEEGSNIKIIQEDAFDFNDNLKSITLPTHGNQAFIEYRTSTGTQYNIGESISNNSLAYYSVCPYELTADDVEFDKTTGTLTEISNLMERTVIIPDNFDGVSVTAIGDFTSFTYIKPVAHGSTNPLINITIPVSVEKIAENAFLNNHLYSVTLEGSSYLKEIEVKAFSGNSGLETISFPGNSNETFIEYRSSIGTVFSPGDSFDNFLLPYYAITPYTLQSEDLKTEDYNGNPTPYIYGYENMEEKCIIIPNTMDGHTLTSINENAFIYGADLIYLEIPNTIERIGEQAFSGNCLTEITIPASVKSIGHYAFGGNDLVSVTISEGITTLGQSAFENNKIENVSLPGTINTLNTDVFRDNKISSIDLPEGLERIESGAFQKNLLSSIILPSTVFFIGENAFSDNPELSSIALPNPVVKEGYTFIAWVDGNGETVSQITDFTTSYEAQFNKSGFTVSGTLPSNLADIELVISGSVNDIISFKGSYSIVLNAGRSVVITPKKQNYVFTPESITITDINADISEQNFVASYNSTTSVEESGASPIKLYPNPATDIINIESEHSGSITIVSLSGQIIMNQKLLSGTTTLNVNHLHSGIYIAQIRKGKEVINLKFVK